MPHTDEEKRKRESRYINSRNRRIIYLFWFRIFIVLLISLVILTAILWFVSSTG